MDLKKRLRRAYRHYLRNKNWRRIVRMMAAIVVFCTTYALILPAITQETGLICGLTEHVHEDSCYETVVLTDDAGHVHTDTCYQEEKTLQCPMEEQEDHSHTEECYILSKTLICTLPEREGDGCAAVLVCPMEEHIHDERCYGPTEPAESQAETLPEGNPEADLETAEQWEASFGTLELSGDWSADLVALAKTQLGYGESRENYILAEDGSVLGYTRYGQWYGEPYAPWDGMFVSFCLHYAGVEGIGPEQDCVLWLETLNGQELYRERTQYQPVSGDLIFLDRDGDGSCDHVGIVEAVTEAAEETPGTVQFIAGDWEDRVDRSELAAEDASILGYACLPVEPDENQLGDPDNGLADAQLQVSLPEDTAVPADAMPVMTPVTEEDQDYADRISQIQDAVEVDTEQVSLLDISFYDEQQNYLPVGETAIVSVQFPGNPFGDNQVKVFHFVDGQAVELEKVAVNSIITADEDGTESVQTQLIFETEGFSVFAVVEVLGKYQCLDLTDLSQLEGNSFYIISNSKGYGMLASNNSETRIGLSKEAITLPDNLGNTPKWTFTKNADGTYLIHSGEKYLYMKASTSEVASMQVTNAAGATSFTVDKYDDVNGVGQVVISYTENNVTYYVNLYQGNTGPGFYGWKDPPQWDGGSKNYLYQDSVATDFAVPVTDLSGKDFAIVNETKHAAMSSVADTEDQAQKAALDAVPATTIEIDGITYFQSTDDVPLWHFTAVAGKSGVYYISTTVGTETKYLNMTTDFSGDLTLGTTPQELTVTAQSNGKVLIGNGYTYINSSGSDTEGDFWCYNGDGPNSQQTLCLKSPVDSYFTVTHGGHTIKVHLQDAAGNVLYANRTDYTLSDAELKFKDLAPAVEDYTYSYAYFVDNGNIEIAGIGKIDDSQFRLYQQAYYDGTATGAYYTKNTDMDLYLVYRSSSPTIYYALNRPSGTWVSGCNPAIATTSQKITGGAGNLLEVGGQIHGRFVLNTLTERSDIQQCYDDLNAGATADTYLPAGAEYVFQGWKATVNGQTCLFPENAQVSVDANGNVLITDTEGNQQTIPAGTMLQGQWKMVSNVVMFFVNHGDTMLENEMTHSIANTSNEYYAGVVAVAHLYNPPAKNIDTGDIQRATHEIIEGQMVPFYDPANSAAQLVIDAVRFKQGGLFTAVSNYNEYMLEEAVGSYLRSNKDDTKKILLDNAELDQEQITAENYKLYWYVEKLVDSDGNAYHIDGVLVAKTQRMEIYKTFSGLTQEQAQTALGNMSFPLYLISTTSGVDEKNTYKTLTAMGSETGVYSYDGRQGEGNIYKWTLESVQGQRYAFEEQGYELTDYDCSSLISVHFKSTQEGVPGAVIWQYNTDQTYTDLDTSANTITDLYKDTPLVGGEVERIIFANFYTKEGTGMFSISKVADAAGRVRLAGAKFQLKKDSTVITETTNQNGAAHFSNLEPGTYTLEEIEAPAGYQKLNTQWTVEVEKSDDGVVTVTIDGDQIYDSSKGGIQEIYLIQNDPESTTVTVNKQFKVITDAEFAELKDNYCIKITDVNGNLKNTLTLANAVASTGTYTWTVDLECEKNYTFTEYNYSHKNYLDTVVSAVINGTVAPVEKLNGNTVASFSVTKTEAADTVNITNTYSNTFDLQILKVDATDSNAPMKGVYFNIYGDFHFSTTAPEGTASTISYTDGKGNSQVAYYVGRTAVTDANGMTLFKNMKLSAGTDTFLYVIDEANTPAGYVKLKEPIVRIVKVDGDDPNYHNGVYTLTVENFQEFKATVTVTAEKVWSLPDGMTLADYPDVTLYLYKRVRNVEDDKAADTYSLEATVTLNEDTGWKQVWKDLPYANGNVRNEYFVREEPIDGFATSYSTQVHTFEAGTVSVNAAIAEGRELDRSVTITNSTGLKLPDTGGVAGELFGILGLMLMTAAPWQGWLRVKKSKARGHADSK